MKLWHLKDISWFPKMVSLRFHFSRFNFGERLSKSLRILWTWLSAKVSFVKRIKRNLNIVCKNKTEVIIKILLLSQLMFRSVKHEGK